MEFMKWVSTPLYTPPAPSSHFRLSLIPTGEVEDKEKE